jgi:acetyltransferase
MNRSRLDDVDHELNIMDEAPDTWICTLPIRREILLLRPLRADDTPALATFFASLSPQTLYQRYFLPLPAMSPQHITDEIQRLNRLAMAGVVLLGRLIDHGSMVVLVEIARLDSDRSTAEIAMTVADAHQRQGIGRQMRAILPAVLAHHSIARVQAAALAENRAIMKLFGSAGATTSLGHGIVTFQIG